MEGDSQTSIADRVHRRVHRRVVFDRRRDRLATALVAALPSEPSNVLDIGCGSGEIGSDLEDAGHRVVGVEVLARETCAIPFARFDGRRLPFADDAFDHAVIVDVLHHTADPTAVLAEARRVTTGSVVLKDHYAESGRARFTLGVMDWVGNRQFGVGREGAYLSHAQWLDVFAAAGLVVDDVSESLDLYPTPAKPFFENGLHFVARLVHVGATDASTGGVAASVSS
jgi:SAM-dependent methyltransferase